MAKIQRKTQKIFGQNASNDQLAAFGSMAAGAPIYTDDIEALQTAKYEEGWKTAVVADNAPFMEEMNGVQYGLSKQIAYILQQGIPEYDDGTTYYKNSWCQIEGTFYQSLTDDNIGNNPASSSTNWKPWEFIDIATDEEIAEGESTTTAVTPKQLKDSIESQIIGALKYIGTWNATGQTDYSSIELPVKAGYMYYVEGSATINGLSWETGDYLIINEDVETGGSITNVQLVDNTESSDIVRLDAEQTITNKTIDAEDNTILNLTPDNFKPGQGFVAESGGTMTGNLQMNVAGIRIKTTETGYTDITGCTDTISRYGLLRFNAQNNKYSVQLVPVNVSTNIPGTSIGVTYDPSTNTTYTEAPTPSANDNSTKIATTAFVNQAADGHWVKSNLDIISSSINVPKDTTLTFSLSSYLPNDSYNYEILLSATVSSLDNSTSTVDLRLGTDFFDAGSTPWIGCKSINNTSTIASGIATIPIGASRNILIRNPSTTNDFKLNICRAKAYRRIGTNN